ncbi:MAG: type II toxin-antitoxin system RelE/ParE family toxin [Candidatus Omnitrophica bacterium]|nr:type II toxin-antitoxin system RelE/ParE family toxin [Candidatus Omnitrophota bacterium]
MPNYQVGFPSERAEKEFQKILSKASKKEQERILGWFDKLAENPKPQGKSFKSLKGELIVYQYLAQYRIREGDWRILYDIDEDKKRIVLLALRRRGHHAYD